MADGNKALGDLMRDLADGIDGVEPLPVRLAQWADAFADFVNEQPRADAVAALRSAAAAIRAAHDAWEGRVVVTDLRGAVPDVSDPAGPIPAMQPRRKRRR